MDPTPGSSQVEHLDLATCWTLLREASTGRLAVVRDGAPDIFPVNHVVDHGTLVYRTADGALFRATLHHDVAFEVDGHEAGTGQAWSVVVRGWATEGRHLTDVVESLQLPLAPWQPGAKPRVIRIEPHTVTGRRFTMTDSSRHHTV
ncbi:MAG TPA: pyridoxamine 5'-phosphate oxidase family protein [Ornithinimicrobium sp.]|uniref:pyridoxamine 5'-phosphate oxidase family protein n=1 Tax=Ornithinimicrobium sp. TaxID=1977084 RepID=UPI002B4648BF|nr:pyridoxamine 5'-phosphate oxidase family protein [Ornithinimicrobium sp.]HKJ11390.1 pyridoxamine 5'-phosphate oxidase family protein [Ornithinimicrobium sp.]